MSKRDKNRFLRASMFVTCYIKLFRTGADRHNGILMSLFLLVAETNRDIRTMSMTSFRCLYCSFLADFTHYCNVSIVNFEKINAVAVC